MTVAKRSHVLCLPLGGSQARGAARRSIWQQEQSTAAACDRQAGVQQSALTASRTAESVQLRTDSFLIHRTRPALEPRCALGFFSFGTLGQPGSAVLEFASQSQPVSQSTSQPILDPLRIFRKQSDASPASVGWALAECVAALEACVRGRLHFVGAAQSPLTGPPKRRIGAPEPQQPSGLLLLPYCCCCCDCCF